MARTASQARAIRDEAGGHEGHLRVGEECLEMATSTTEDASVLRSWIRRINAPSYPQPFLVEGPPGRFRLYVGDAAERIRTARGIQP